MIPSDKAGLASGQLANMDDEDSSLRWARQQYSAALHKLVRVSPVSALTGVRPGEVLVSKSGNTRLVLCVEDRDGDSLLTFLSRLRSGGLRLETAQLRKIDVSRVDALVLRRSGSPLENFSELIRSFHREKVLMHNLEVLMYQGELGRQIEKTVRSCTPSSTDLTGVFVKIGLAVSPGTGRIEGIGRARQDEPCKFVTVLFNKLGVPSEDYIKSAAFPVNTERVIKRNILAACVLANTIENARNLLCMAQMAGI